MELSGKKVVIPVENMFNTHEFWYPFSRRMNWVAHWNCVCYRNLSI
jgi:hypothetical protein